MSTFSLIIPAYNEEKRILPTLHKYVDFLQKKMPSRFEILVVLNGTRDNSAQLLNDFCKNFQQVRYLDIKGPIGKGGAIVAGFENAKMQNLGYTDADGATSPVEFFKLIQNLENQEVDCVIASRSLPQSQVTAKSKLRNFLSWGFNTCVNLLFNLKIKDTQCGAKVLTKKSYKVVRDNLFISGLSFDVNMLLFLHKKGFKILETPISWQDKDGSTISHPIRFSLIMFLSLIRLKIYSSRFTLLKKWLKPFSEFFWNIILTEEEKRHRTIQLK